MVVQRGFSDQLLNARQQDAKPVNDALTTIRVKAGEQASHSDQWLDSYRESGPDKFFLPYAIDVATSVSFTGNPSVSLKEAGDYLATQGRVDLAMSLLPIICDGLGIPYRQQIYTARTLSPVYPIANPVAWSLGTEAYLESLRMVPAAAGNLNAQSDRLGTITNEQLDTLWKGGLVIREAVIVSTSTDAVRTTATTYRKASTGLLSSLADSVRGTADGFPFQKPFTLRPGTWGFHQPPFQYLVNPSPYNPNRDCIPCSRIPVFEIDKDPLDFAINNHLVHLEEVPAMGNTLDRSPTGEHGNSYRIVIDVGAAKGPFQFNGQEMTSTGVQLITWRAASFCISLQS